MDFSKSKISKKTLPCISSLKFEDKWSSTLNSYGPVPSTKMSADQIRQMANDAWTIARPELSGESCSALFQNGHATGDVRISSGKSGGIPRAPT